ncbi:MAG: DUF4815 domain-containing protein, partial [Thermoplasmata archaeon]|nr:DUF4815 domain-containing protein [Thermoplasmata archaeon]
MKFYRLSGVFLIVLFFVLSLFNDTFSDTHKIEQFPDQREKGYTWYRGCGPTSLSMVLNYYGSHGFPHLYDEPYEFAWSGPDWLEHWWIPDFIEWDLLKRYAPRDLVDTIVNTINSHRLSDKRIPAEGPGDYGVTAPELARAAKETSSFYGYNGFNSEVKSFDYNKIKEEIDKNRPLILCYNTKKEPEIKDVVTITRGEGSRDDLKQAIKIQIDKDVDRIIEIYGVATNEWLPDFLLTWDWETETWSGATQEYKKTTDYTLTIDGDNYYIDWTPSGNEPSPGTSYKVACKFHVHSGHAIAVFGYDFGGSHIFRFYNTWDPEAQTKNWDNVSENHCFILVKPPVRLDLIFTIDVTGSMWDDIDAVKASATEIVNEISNKVPDWRIAVVDFQDFPVYPYGCEPDYMWPGYPGDWPYRAILPFST